MVLSPDAFKCTSPKKKRPNNAYPNICCFYLVNFVSCQLMEILCYCLIIQVYCLLNVLSTLGYSWSNYVIVLPTKSVKIWLKIKNFVETILELAPIIGVLSFKHCPRNQNGVAHSLARMDACCSSDVCFVVEE